MPTKREADDDDDDDGMAEITAALKEIGETMPAPRPERDALSADASVSGRDALMCVDTRRLKAEDELRSIFGASVIRAVETEDGGNNADANALGHIGRNPRAPGKGGKMQAKLTNARSMLVTPKDGWPPYRAKGTGLAMECVDAAGFVKTFRIVRTDDFADADAAYKRAVASHDPNNLHDLLRYWPWHVDALAALSDVYHYAGEGSKSAELLERCLYAMEGAWHPWFAQCVADGTARMDARVNTDADTDFQCGCQFAVLRVHVQARAGDDAARVSSRGVGMREARVVAGSIGPARVFVRARLLRAAVRGRGLAPGLCGRVRG